MPKVLFVGFSVTLQTNGYYNSVKEKLDGDYHFNQYAVGGANLHFVLYVLNDINFENYDIVIFEVSTSSRWLGEDYERYKNILLFIVNYAQAYINKIGFLDFTRLDVDSNDALHSAVRKVCIESGIPCSSWKGNLDDFVYDGIHPNSRGIDQYSNMAVELLKSLESMPKLNILDRASLLEQYNKYHPFFLSVDRLSFNEKVELVEFKKGGLKKVILKVREDNKIFINFSEPYVMNGILLKIGPSTGILKVQSNEEDVVDKLPYDERSYYERYFPLFFRMENVKKLILSCERAHNRPKLLKGEEYKGEQNIFIVGFFLSKIKLPF